MPNTPSTQRMKRALANALLDLMAQKPLDTITVQEVTHACQIRRQSFYYHFSDLYALVDWILEQERISFHESWHDFLNWQTYFLAVLSNFDQNRPHYQCIVNALGSPYLLRIFQEDLQELLQKTLDFYLPNSTLLDAKEVEFLVFYYSNVAMALLGSWLRQDITYTAQELVNQLDTLLQDHVRGLLARLVPELETLEDDGETVFFLPENT